MNPVDENRKESRRWELSSGFTSWMLTPKLFPSSTLGIISWIQSLMMAIWIEAKKSKTQTIVESNGELWTNTVEKMENVRLDLLFEDCDRTVRRNDAVEDEDRSSLRFLVLGRIVQLDRVQFALLRRIFWRGIFLNWTEKSVRRSRPKEKRENKPRPDEDSVRVESTLRPLEVGFRIGLWIFRWTKALDSEFNRTEQQSNCGFRFKLCFTNRDELIEFESFFWEIESN